ncbi:mechanosensitive ion channel [Parasphingopyxis lamellibrachiae]|uniref:Small-conductance mechanosensitive channel n=1 Tax=Parasphingopyxis lamellibrachiae TaxID=680125 RepID=A0A3D9FBG6_9SPHN|nr:mechanosensitive ion channel [Parasphingopyxis lamellibrachiae]RED15028.1 putative transporter (transmembrane protein) [Parasphingopyxis lamellibrachiae]
MEFDLNRDIDWALIWEWSLKIGAALLILLITHFIAKAVKWAIARMVDKIPALQKHSSAEPGETVGSQIGSLAYWIVWLVGLVVALQPLELSGVLDPVRELTTDIFGFLPNLIGAGLIMFGGVIVATIVRRIVETSLKAINADAWFARAGAGEITGGDDVAAGSGTSTSLSGAIGVIVFVLIIIPIATGALQTLQLTSISEPLVAILNDVAFFIPRMIAAALILGTAYFIGRWVKGWIEQVLGALGVDAAASGSGLVPESVHASKVIGTIALTAIMLVSAVAAIEVLEIQSVQAMVTEVVALGSRVIFGLVIIAVGILLARVLSNLMASSTGESGLLQTILKWLIIALFAAMGLKFMQIADEIVVIAFAAILGSAAVAAAIAFGLGGRPTAHKLLERWTEGKANRTNPGDKTPPGI